MFGEEIEFQNPASGGMGARRRAQSAFCFLPFYRRKVGSHAIRSDCNKAQCLGKLKVLSYKRVGNIQQYQLLSSNTSTDDIKDPN